MKSFRINLIFIVFLCHILYFSVIFNQSSIPPLTLRKRLIEAMLFSTTPRAQTLNIRLGSRGVCCCAIETKSGYIAELMKIDALLS